MSYLAVATIVLVALGGGLSYWGYDESLQSVTVADSQPYTATSTRTIASTTMIVESYVVTTGTVSSILNDYVINLNPPTGRWVCAYYDYAKVALDAGRVRVSYVSEGGRPVNFWLLNRDPRTIFRYCSDIIRYSGPARIVVEKGLSEADLTVDIPSGGDYYFTFLTLMNSTEAVSITLNVERIVQTEVATHRILYSTAYSS